MITTSQSFSQSVSQLRSLQVTSSQGATVTLALQDFKIRYDKFERCGNKAKTLLNPCNCDIDVKQCTFRAQSGFVNSLSGLEMLLGC